MKDFRDLKVWQKSHKLTLEIYQLTRAFPKEEAYGLTSQMRRSAVSISANIAEGCNRGGDKEFSRFCRIAIGSATELEYLLLLASDLNLPTSSHGQTLSQQVIEIKKCSLRL